MQTAAASSALFVRCGTEDALKADEKVICVCLNGWQFQEYEDAKTVLIVRISAVLEEEDR